MKGILPSLSPALPMVMFEGRMKGGKMEIRRVMKVRVVIICPPRMERRCGEVRERVKVTYSAR
jgi:hypothetical protein